MASRSFSWTCLLALSVLWVAVSASAASEEQLPLVADDECAATGAEGAECTLSALQLRAGKQEVEGSSCEGPWCSVIHNFDKDFDTNVPAQMQKGMNEYTEWKSANEGIKVAVTKDHYYEMYHGNVESKLGQYMPQGLFDWHFDKNVTFLRKEGDNKVVLMRKGTITFNLGWWRRSMFWNACVKGLPDGHNFDFSSVTEFDDCKACPAKMEYTVQKGGPYGKDNGWKIVDLVLIKLS